MIVAVALGLRLARLDAAGLWIDEKHTLLNQAGLSAFGEADREQLLSEGDLARYDTWRGMFQANTVDNGGNGLAYLALMRAWVAFAGPRDASLRLPSVLFGVLTVLVGCLLARRTTCSRRAVFIAAALLAVYPLLVREAQEARAYSMAAALGALSTYLFLGLLRRRSLRTWLLWCATHALLFFTHYFGITLLLSQLGFSALFVREKSRARMVAGGSLLVAAIVSLWLTLGGADGLAVAQGNSAILAHNALEAGSPEFPSPVRLSAASSYLLLQLLGNHLIAWGLKVRVAALLLAAPLALLWLAWAKRRHAARATRLAVDLCFLQAAVAFAFAFGFSIAAGHVSAFHPKYSIAVVPSIAVLLGVGLDRALRGGDRRRPLHVVAVSIQTAVLAVSLASVYARTEVLPPWPPARGPNPYLEIASAAGTREASEPLRIDCPRLVDAKIMHVLLEGRADVRYLVASIRQPTDDAVVIRRGERVLGRYVLSGRRY